MAISKTNGATLGASATLPATFDGAGYAAVTFTALGEVVDIGELAKAYNIITHQPVGQDYPDKLKGTYDIGNISITLGRDSADGGQVLLQAALASDNSYSFELVLPSGDTGNFTAKVIKAGLGSVASDGVETTVVELAVDAGTLYEA